MLALTEIYRADVPFTRLVPVTRVVFAHRRLRGLQRLQGRPDRSMEDLVARTMTRAADRGDRSERSACALDALNAMHYNALQISEGVSLQDQITVRLPSDLGQALRRASRRLRRKNSDVVRMALEAFLGAGTQRGARPADHVRALIGSLTSGVPDLAERHREHIIEALRRGR